MEDYSPTKVSQHRLYEERKIANFSDQDLATKFDISCIINKTILSPTLEKNFSSVSEPNTLCKSDNNVEEVHISETGNFFQNIQVY